MATKQAKKRNKIQICKIPQIIGSFYAKHFVLIRYIREVQQDKALKLIQDGDPDEYRLLLKTTLIAVPRDQPVTPPFKPSKTQWFTLKEITVRVIEHFCRGNKTNVLAYGFESLTGYGKKGIVAGTVGIQNSYPNTVVSYLRTARAWKLLHERIGDDLMIHLLQNLSIFAKVNSCYFQVAGYPITRLSRMTSADVFTPLPVKKAEETVEDRGTLNAILNRKSRRGGKRARRYRENVRAKVNCSELADAISTTDHPPVFSRAPVQMNANSSSVVTHLAEVPQSSGKRKRDSLDSDDVSRDNPNPSKKQSSTNSNVLKSTSPLLSEDGLINVEITAKSFLESATAVTVADADQAKVGKEFSDVVMSNTTDLVDSSETQGSVISKTSREQPKEPRLKYQGGLVFPQPVGVEEQTHVQTLKRKKSVSIAVRVENEKNEATGGRKGKQKGTAQSNSQLKEASKQQIDDSRGSSSLKKNRKSICLNEMLIPRSKMFYTSNLSQTFPKNHIVESLPVSMAGARKLAQHIFLQGTFLGACGDRGGMKKDERKEPNVNIVNQAAVEKPDGSNTLKLTPRRKQKPFRLPKRLKTIVPMLHKFLARHHKCPFRTLVKLYCRYDFGRPVIKSGKKKRMLERIPFGVKMVYHKLCLKSRAKSTQRKRRAQRKVKVDVVRYRRAVSMFTEHHQVVGFLKGICKKVVPKEIWGSPGNKETFFRNLGKFIRLYRAEKFSLAQMMSGIKVSSCKWLQLRKSGSGKRVALSDSVKQLELLAQFMWWLVNSYLMTVLKTFFYITETGIHRQRVFYYRKPIWETIQQFSLRTFCDEFFKPLKTATAENLLRAQNSLGFSLLRFLPKTSTVRPITNMRHCPTSKELSVNSKLKNLFEVVKFEKERNPEKMGTTLFGTDDLYRALKPFSTRSRTRLEGKPLYFVHVDVSHCYESILHQKLFDIMKEVLEEEEYLIRRFALLRMSGGKVYREFSKDVSTADDCRLFPDFFRSLVVEWKLRQVVVVDNVWYATEDRDKLIKLLEEHIFNNFVKIGNKYYQQKRGIAQGSILSTMLCGYYYSQMERTHLSEIAQDTDSLLLRWVDDFLFVTPHRRLADKFLNTMRAGIPEYGCVINHDKTLTNYTAVTADGHKVTRIGVSDRFPWCGFLLDTVTLEVSPDLSRYTGSLLRDSLTVSLDAHPGEALSKKLRYSVRPKCHPLLLDPNMNTRENTLLNVFHVFLLTAYKFHTYVKELPRGSKPKDNPSFFARMILDLAQYFYSTSARKCLQLSPNESAFSLDEHEVTWLCLYAFQMCLRRTQSRYREILTFLRKSLSQIHLSDRIKLPTTPWNAALTKLVRMKKRSHSALLEESCQ
ncbi:Telomerase reverse transcriptase [Stylophora pistillata]|uniref:Telomerase reverse transcriptase n=1 Tax=Stylophora pistillata TaxID=50429 RepID=A0A2B4SX04_STYPI|nr:Telomerase reverse transcriptase [Stylophora pistillata]